MKLIFIYNANSGNLNALLDAGHKLFSPSTYKCSLCALTYDTFAENTIWKNFRAESNLDMEFYHKDEFELKFTHVKMTYPAILKLESQQLSVVLDNELLDVISNVETLIKRLKVSL